MFKLIEAIVQELIPALWSVSVYLSPVCIIGLLSRVNSLEKRVNLLEQKMKESDSDE